MTKTKAPRNRNEIIARVVSWMFVIGTAYFSASHIVGLSYANGLSTAEAFAAVPFIDGFGVLGRILRSLPSRKARRGGTVMMFIAGGVSLGANMAQGHTLGQKAFGLLTVVGFVAAEWAVGLVKEAASDAEIETGIPAPAPQITAADVQAAVSAAVAATLAQAAIDQQAAIDTAVAAAVKRTEQRITRRQRAAERAAAELVDEAAPVSPGAPVLFVPTMAEVREVVTGRR